MFKLNSKNKTLKRGFALLFVFTSLFVTLLSLNSSSVKAVGEEYSSEYIKSYNVDVLINDDGKLDITEDITHVNNASHHGLIRNIPISKVKYKGIDLANNIKVQDVLVAKEGSDVFVKATFEVTNNGGNIDIKIGDANVYISGTYIYKINYIVSNGIRFFDDHDELYWNIIGTEWDMPVQDANFSVKSSFKSTDQICFTGVSGSKGQNCVIEASPNDTIVKGKSTQRLGVNEGLTIAVAYPMGSYPRPSDASVLFKKFLFILPLLLIFPTWLLMHLIWLKFGNDPEPKGVHPQYEAPASIDPLISGYVIDQDFNSKHISAYIIDLAVKGYITIEKVAKKGILGKDNFILYRTDKELINPKSYETTLLYGLFLNGKTSDINSLKDEFYKTVSAVSSQVGDYAVDANFVYAFGKIMRSASKVIIGLIIALVFIGPVFFSMLSVFLLSPLWGVYIVAAVIMTFIYARSMPKRTKLGTETLGNLLGLKMYIETAEIDKIKFHNDPTKFSGVFETLLPYAMIFKLEKLWADKFKDLYTTPPNWYKSNDFTMFNAYILTSSISDSFSKSMTTASAAPHSSGGSGFGGGGFSGGGGGGGGGGSW